MNNFAILLDISSALLLLALFLAGAYEMIAILNYHIPFTSNLPTITDIVRPWVTTHKAIALGIAALILAAFFWLFGHFFL